MRLLRQTREGNFFRFYDLNFCFHVIVMAYFEKLLFKLRFTLELTCILIVLCLHFFVVVVVGGGDVRSRYEIGKEEIIKIIRE